MRYPQEAGANGADTIVFTHEEYRNNRQGGGGGTAGPPAGGGGAITLYMPNTTPSLMSGQNWGAKSFEGPLNKFRSDLAMQGANLVQNLEGSDFTSTDGLRSLGERVGKELGTAFNNGMQNAGPMAKQAITEGIAKLGGYENASQLMAMSRGEIYNPNVELLYRGTGLRTFSFNYTFVPKSEQEAQNVNRIIMEFKKWSAPEDTGNGMFKVPHVWNVTYMTGGSKNKNMNAFKKAALTGVTVQHNPGLDMPIVTALSLSFQEVDIITRGDHDESGSNIGY
jgi:hypothetical protein